MSIQEQINQIIDERHRYLPELDKKADVLKGIEAELARLEHVRSQMITPEGEVIRDGRYSELLVQNPEMQWNLQGIDTRSVHKALETARRELERCRQRFARDSISISVVGEARIGKSSLLKAISGLNDHVIPAFSSTDCTGAPSIIYNKSGEHLKALIRFKSRRQMMEIAQVYLDKIIRDPEKRICLSSMEEIRRLDTDDVEARAPKGSADLNKLGYLRRMVRTYDEWSVYAGRTETLVLTDEREIATFVAQNNGRRIGDPERVEYSRYLAVEKCEIWSQFPKTDAARINLVDTVGLDDDSEGIEESMLRVVEEESDAVVFMLRPSSGAGRGLPKHVVGIYKLIEENCRDRDLSKWLFYFINHVERTAGQVAENTEYCNALAMALKEFKYHGAEHRYIVNAMDPDAVNDRFLKPMLVELSKNLKVLDGAFMARTAAALKELQAEYGALCARAQRVLRSDVSRNASLIPLITGLTAKIRADIKGTLFRLMEERYARKDEPCAEIYRTADGILQRMTQHFRADCYIPGKDELQKQLETGAQPPQLFIDYENRIRNAVSRDFLEVDVNLKRFVDAMKDSVAETLCETCGLGAVVKRDAVRPMREWLGDFAAALDPEDYPTLRLAFDALSQFEFSVKGFLTFEVRDALNTLDPDHSAMPILPGMQGNHPAMAGSLRANLLQRMVIIADELKKRLRSLSCKPNMACFAEINDFYDRLVYAEGAEAEWTRFFAENSGVLWADEIKKVQTVGILCRDWVELVDALAGWNVTSNFVLMN